MLIVFAGLLHSAWNTVMMGKQKSKAVESTRYRSHIVQPLPLVSVLVYSFAI